MESRKAARSKAVASPRCFLPSNPTIPKVCPKPFPKKIVPSKCPAKEVEEEKGKKNKLKNGARKVKEQGILLSVCMPTLD